MFPDRPSLLLACLTSFLAGACTSSRGDVFTTERAVEATQDCAGAIYCSDFETTPDGLSSAASGEIGLIPSPTHSGVGALRASVGGRDGWARLDIALPDLRQVGLRAWVNLDEGAAELLASEVYVLIALHTTPELSEGGLSKVSVDLETEFQLVLVETVESASKLRSGLQLDRGSWHCLRFWIAGQPGFEQASLELDGQVAAKTSGDASAVPPGGFQQLFLGIEYSLGATPLTVYYDDVMVDEAAPACDD